MAKLDILCSNLLNLKNKITKIEHKKIFCNPLKTLLNISWPINICPKTLWRPPAIYLMHHPLSNNNVLTQPIESIPKFSFA